MKRFLPVILFTVSAVILYASGSGEKHLDIYYTASLNGNLDGCTCRSNPKAGFVKRAVFLRAIDKKSSILVDAGDIFDVYEDPLLSDYILESYSDLGYDFIAVGDQEFSNGAVYLLKRIKSGMFISNNLSIQDAGGVFVRVSSGPAVVSRSGITVAVMSVADKDAFRFYKEEVREKIRIEDPYKTVKSLLAVPESMDADLRLLLFHGPLKHARKIASENPSLNIIIAAHEQQLVSEKTPPGVLIVSPGAEGNITGKLTVSISSGRSVIRNSFIEFSYADDPDDAVIRKRIDGYVKTMKDRLKVLPAGKN